jgi:DNA polymerase (family 10)
MDNKSISRTLKLFGQLMELHGQNEFKSRSVLNASFRIDKLPYPLNGKSINELSSIDGVGKSIAAKVSELIQTGAIAELTALIDITPPGIIEMMTVKGLGPKKIQIIWKHLGIESIGELLYACNENRLIEAKGFGQKTQEEVRQAIEFRIAGSGSFLYAQVEEFASQLMKSLTGLFPDNEISLTGEFRRKCEIIQSVDVLLATTSFNAAAFAEKTGLLEDGEITNGSRFKTHSGLSVNILTCAPQNFYRQLFLSTGAEYHVKTVLDRLDSSARAYSSEEAIYSGAGLPYIEPELREGIFEFRLAEQGTLPRLITLGDLRGSLHNHSTWSDGVNTLEEMALFCRDELKLDYLGICDHSKTAVYAKGLSEARVLAQQEEITLLNSRLAPFQIFKGIESDILGDGALDYTDDILATFDFVVASIHSAFRMDEERATARLIKAVENPYTTILGHPTGRLLLSRKGYPVDFKKLIDACAANGVAIEINANPLRLDMDWRWHQYAMEKGVMLSVNPDAHRTTGFYDMHYGVLAARKGGVSPEYCLNAFTLDQIISWFTAKKKG